MQPGEIEETCADIEKSTALLNFRPAVPLEKGIPRFIEWYQNYSSSGKSVPC
jgi:UDP-glucuronate 4-epimerase